MVGILRIIFRMPRIMHHVIVPEVLFHKIQVHLIGGLENDPYQVLLLLEFLVDPQSFSPCNIQVLSGVGYHEHIQTGLWLGTLGIFRDLVTLGPDLPAHTELLTQEFLPVEKQFPWDVDQLFIDDQLQIDEGGGVEARFDLLA